MRTNIYQMYVENNCRLGFYVRRDSWNLHRYARVVAIEGVTDGEMIEGKPPYFGGIPYPKGHRKEGKIMHNRVVALQADWFENGIWETDCGGTYKWTRVYPKEEIPQQ